jgi:hypothetical protein
MSTENSNTIQPCTLHGVNGCYLCLKKAVEEVLYMTYAAGNGGFASDFGLITFRKLVDLTGYDVDKRRVNNR